MAVPKFYEFMKPLLEELKDGQMHTIKEKVEIAVSKTSRTYS